MGAKDRLMPEEILHMIVEITSDYITCDRKKCADCDLLRHIRDLAKGNYVITPYLKCG